MSDIEYCSCGRAMTTGTISTYVYQTWDKSHVTLFGSVKESVCKCSNREYTIPDFSGLEQVLWLVRIQERLLNDEGVSRREIAWILDIANFPDDQYRLLAQLLSASDNPFRIMGDDSDNRQMNSPVIRTSLVFIKALLMANNEHLSDVFNDPIPEQWGLRYSTDKIGWELVDLQSHTRDEWEKAPKKLDYNYNLPLTIPPSTALFDKDAYEALTQSGRDIVAREGSRL